jgi:hypothetical protein
MHKAAAWLYFISLIYVLCLWGKAYCTDSAPPQVIGLLGQSVLGLFGGVLAVVLNTDKIMKIRECGQRRESP